MRPEETRKSPGKTRKWSGKMSPDFRSRISAIMTDAGRGVCETMRSSRPRLTIRRLMILVAAGGVLFAAAPAPAGDSVRACDWSKNMPSWDRRSRGRGGWSDARRTASARSRSRAGCEPSITPARRRSTVSQHGGSGSSYRRPTRLHPEGEARSSRPEPSVGELQSAIVSGLPPSKTVAPRSIPSIAARIRSSRQGRTKRMPMLAPG